MIEQILKGENIRSACKQVVSNKGSAGVDGMTVKELSHYFKSNRKDLCTRIRSDQYFAQAILGVEIPKENGKKRLLGIPKLLSYYLFFTVFFRNVLLQLMSFKVRDNSIHKPKYH